MAFDSVRGVTVLFGGRDNYLFDETWEYDGTSWVLREPATTKPPPLEYHEMVYHSGRMTVMLYGGIYTNQISINI